MIAPHPSIGTLPAARAIRPGQESLFPIAAHLLNAEHDGVRASILLRLSDVVLMDASVPLAAACREAKFTEGGEFIDLWLAALCSRRGPDGQLPNWLAASLDYRRARLIALAQGQ